MIEFSYFKRLPVWSQAELLVKEGTALSTRQHKGWSVTLYHVQSHFVELWQKEGLQVTTSFRQEAHALGILEPYLDGLEVEQLP